MRRYIRILGVNLAVLLGLMVIMELALRALGLNYGSCPLNRDSLLHHVHPKDYTYLSYDIRGEFGGFNVRFDSHGRRINISSDESEDHQPELWFLGDSYTVACQVSWEDSYVGRVENLLDGKFRTINYGVSGYSPMMYYTLLKNELEQNKPDMVFIQLCENDPDDEERFEQMASFNNRDEPIFIDGGKTNHFLQLARSSYLLKALRRAQLTADFWVKTRKRDRMSPNVGGVNNLIGSNRQILPSDSRFIKSIGQINALLDSLEIEHYFFFIPPKETVRDASWNPAVLSTNFNQYALDEAIPYIDLDAPFKKEAGVRPLYFDEDYHCNAAGHAVIAAELAQKIKE